MKPKTILLVDDDMVFLRAMSQRLGAEGYQVCTAEDGAGAVAALREVKPDLIFLDIHFPPDVGHGGGVAWDGFLIANWLQRMGGIAGTPVIFLTASDPAPLQPKATKAGAAGLFQKSVELNRLLDRVRQLLQGPEPDPAVLSAGQ